MKTKNILPLPPKNGVEKFTPGPWQWQGSMNSDRIYIGHNSIGVMQGGSDTIATVKMRDDESAFNQGNQTANARLIASAPELFAALENVLRFCVTPAGMPDKGKGRTVEQQAALDAACAAIAKAKGAQ